MLANGTLTSLIKGKFEEAITSCIAAHVESAGLDVAPQFAPLQAETLLQDIGDGHRTRSAYGRGFTHHAYKAAKSMEQERLKLKQDAVTGVESSGCQSGGFPGELDDVGMPDGQSHRVRENTAATTLPSRRPDAQDGPEHQEGAQPAPSWAYPPAWAYFPPPPPPPPLPPAWLYRSPPWQKPGDWAGSGYHHQYSGWYPTN
eukprot:jgi/Botrbrau1/22989/Bobra.0030s0053.2